MGINSSRFTKYHFWISIASIIVALLSLEATIRLYDSLAGYGFLSQHRNKIANSNQSNRSIIPFRTFGFPLYTTISNKKHILSRHGEIYPLEKPQGTFRIVAFGGSTTENEHSYTNTKSHYPLLLQAHLRAELNTHNIEVINVGNSAYATPHSLILFELDVLSWEPDMIIVSHNINDLLTAYWPDFQFDYSNKYGTKYYMPVMYNLSTTDRLFQQSSLYWFGRDKVDRLQSSHANIISRKSYGNHLDPHVTDTFERNINTIIAIAKQNNIKVLLGNQPLQRNEEYFDNHMAYKRYNDIVKYPLHNEFIVHHDTFNRIIEEVAKEANVLFIDNDSFMANEEKLFIDYIHYEPEGVEILAKHYADFILANNIISIN
ncbi:MAG TPA: hypothetical protein DGN60_07585 [Chloroflexi bacterium]|nr:hypothetical protein [Chloroflexota bacterium]|tara:strand:- start:2500 stop:3621 length:1122 start_codon:yes stop_codon:yes gene_type:complete